MPIRDRAVGWKMGRLWIPIRVFQGLDNDGTATLTLSNGTPTLEPITTSEIVGLPMTTADEIAHVLPIPWNLDRDKQVLGRLMFQHAAADADAPIFKVTAKFFGKQDAMTEFIAGADVSVTFGAHTCSTTNPSLEVTDWTDLRWDDYIDDSDVLTGISVELDDLGGASADEIRLLGMELAYEIKATDIIRRKTVAELNRQPV